MRPADENIEKLLNKMHFKASDQTHKKILHETLKAHDQTKIKESEQTQPILWRIIMKNKLTKLATAAVIIITVMKVLQHFGGPIAGTSIAFADIVQPLLAAHTATFKATVKVESGPTQIFDGMYMEPIHMRQTTSDGTIVISDLEKGKIITLLPARNKAVVIELVNMPDDADQSQFNMFAEIKRRIQEAKPNDDEAVEYLGQQRIEGKAAIGYHVKIPGADITVWANQETNMPIQFELSNGPVTYTMTDIVFNVELDESLFDLKIPEGYAVRTMQVDASNPTEKDLLEMFRIWTKYMDGNFPSTLDQSAVMEFVKYQQNKMKENGRQPSEETIMEMQKTIIKMSRGGTFAQELPSESDWHYAGKDARLGEDDVAIFWYRPQGSETYRVIYGDLTVKDVAPENLSRQSKETVSDHEKLLDKADEHNLQVVPKSGFGALKFGMTKDEVVGYLGEPERIEQQGKNNAVMIYPSKGLGITLFKETGVRCFAFTTKENLFSAEAKDFRGTTKKGIGIGASEGQIVAAYGKPSDTNVQDNRKTLNYENLGLEFILLSDKVAHFSIKGP